MTTRVVTRTGQVKVDRKPSEDLLLAGEYGQIKSPGMSASAATCDSIGHDDDRIGALPHVARADTPTFRTRPLSAAEVVGVPVAHVGKRAANTARALSPSEHSRRLAHATRTAIEPLTGTAKAGARPYAIRCPGLTGADGADSTQARSHTSGPANSGAHFLETA